MSSTAQTASSVEMPSWCREWSRLDTLLTDYDGITEIWFRYNPDVAGRWEIKLLRTEDNEDRRNHYARWVESLHEEYRAWGEEFGFDANCLIEPQVSSSSGPKCMQEFVSECLALLEAKRGSLGNGEGSTQLDQAMSLIPAPPSFGQESD